MNVAYFIVVLALLFLVIEIISVVFKITGLDERKARFQVISIITHTGFTTRESELISQHPLRRRIASYLMLISYGAQVALISIFIDILRDNTQKTLVGMAVVIGVLAAAVIILTRNKFLLSTFDSLLEKYLLRRMRYNTRYRSLKDVLKLDDDYGVTEVFLDEKSSLVGVPLKDTGLKERFIQVLNVDRGSEVIHFPTASLVFRPSDKIVVYGKIDSLAELVKKHQY